MRVNLQERIEERDRLRLTDRQNVKALKRAEEEEKTVKHRMNMLLEDIAMRDIVRWEEREDRDLENEASEQRLKQKDKAIQELQEEVLSAEEAVRTVERDRANMSHFYDQIAELEAKLQKSEHETLQMRIQLLRAEEQTNKESDTVRALRLKLEQMEEAASLHSETIDGMEEEKVLILKVSSNLKPNPDSCI